VRQRRGQGRASRVNGEAKMFARSARKARCPDDRMVEPVGNGCGEPTARRRSTAILSRDFDRDRIDVRRGDR